MALLRLGAGVLTLLVSAPSIANAGVLLSRSSSRLSTDVADHPEQRDKKEYEEDGKWVLEPGDFLWSDDDYEERHNERYGGGESEHAAHHGHEDDGHGHSVEEQRSDHVSHSRSSGHTTAYEEPVAGHEHEHGEEQRHGGEHLAHGEADPSSTVVALMLLGMVGWIMFIFYFVNYPDPDVRQATWDVLSSMITIFCGVLIFSATKRALVDFAGEPRGNHHDPPNMDLVHYSLFRLLLVYVALQGIFFAFRKNAWRHTYFSSVCAHVVGFAAIELFGSILHLPFFSENGVKAALGVGMSILAMGFMFLPVSMFRFSNYKMNNEGWTRACDEFEGEAMGLATGLLMSMLIRFFISGDLPAIHGQPRNKTQAQCWQFLAVSICLAPLVMLANYLNQQHDKRLNFGTSQWTHSKSRMLKMLQATTSMTMGWCMLFWGNWQFYTIEGDRNIVGGRMTARIIMALVFSAFVFVMIIVVDMVADRSNAQLQMSFRALCITFALLMGLSWEAAFTEAMSGLGENYPGRWGTYLIIGLTTALCVVVLPAWALFILPHSSEGKELIEHEELEKEEREGVKRTKHDNEELAEEKEDSEAGGGMLR